VREFMLNSEDLLDPDALGFMEEGTEKGLIPCTWIRFNDRIKLAYFPEECGYVDVESRLDQMSLDEICNVGKALLERIKELEGCMEISLENLVWDPDSIYLDDQGQVYFLCLPAVLPEESLNSQIYKKRVYALLEEMLGHDESGQHVCRQMEFQKERQFGDWTGLQEALDRRPPREDEEIVLKSVNTPTPQSFHIGHEAFRIGTDETADGIIEGVTTVSPLHAEIGWNDINFYVMDLESANGTYLNDQKLPPMAQTPVGKGSVLRFADCTFNVE
jgi:hypothetical protein